MVLLREQIFNIVDDILERRPLTAYFILNPTYYYIGIAIAVDY